ncbi:unnamed protein product [Linum trigynum]
MAVIPERWRRSYRRKKRKKGRETVAPDVVQTTHPTSGIAFVRALPSPKKQKTAAAEKLLVAPSSPPLLTLQEVPAVVVVAAASTVAAADSWRSRTTTVELEVSKPSPPLVELLYAPPAIMDAETSSFELLQANWKYRKKQLKGGDRQAITENSCSVYGCIGLDMGGLVGKLLDNIDSMHSEDGSRERITIPFGCYKYGVKMKDGSYPKFEARRLKGRYVGGGRVETRSPLSTLILIEILGQYLPREVVQDAGESWRYPTSKGTLRGPKQWPNGVHGCVAAPHGLGEFNEEAINTLVARNKNSAPSNFPFSIDISMEHFYKVLVL